MLDRVLDDWTNKYDLTPRERALLDDACTESFALAPNGITLLAKKREVMVSTVKKQIAFLLGKTGDKSLMAASVRALREALDRANALPRPRTPFVSTGFHVDPDRG